MNIDLNCDMGESFGAWTMGSDLEMLDIVSSANIACGAHAGDPQVMMRTIQTAHEKGVGIGAHPGFADLIGFGRREMALPAEDLTALVRYQVGAAQGMARSIGAELSHVKLHGAMANMASRDEEMATTCYRAARSIAPDIALMVIAGTAQERAAKRLGGNLMAEIFADRSYEENGTLTPRSVEGSVIHDPSEAAERVLAMLSQGAILPRTGKPIPAKVDTICVHGDTPGAVEMASVLRNRLCEAGYVIQRPFR